MDHDTEKLRRRERSAALKHQMTDFSAKSTTAQIAARYGDYLERLGGVDYRQKVLDYIDREDSPRPVTYQLDLLRRVGFAHVELLHKNGCFAAFGAWKE